MTLHTHKLHGLLEGLDVSGLSTNPQIGSISLDSREMSPGGLFIALRGEQVDAREFIPAVMASGAAAVLIDADDQAPEQTLHDQIQNLIKVKNLRAQLSKIAARFYDWPAEKLKVIGITGTNGKTTIAWYLAQTLHGLGVQSGFMGTLGAGTVNLKGKIELDSTGLTTPDAVQVQKCLAQMSDAGIKVVCMEVSSHGIALGRISEVAFDTVVFSNISQDHLDFHHTMASYAATKMRLFEGAGFRRAVVNSDDELGQKITQIVEGRRLSYGIHKGQLRASDITRTPQGLRFSVSWGKQRLALDSSLIGEFNVYNLLAVLGAGMAQGFGLSDVAEALASCAPVPGRMERIDECLHQPVIVVDYAHTPDALDKALSVCRDHCAGSLAVVFGCGGDRDKAKRPQMGRIAQRLADEVFITDDNPRSELPAGIVSDIQSGMSEPAWVLHDRAQAIYTAIARARADDWVLVAGKGHETSQSYADRVIEFDDRLQVRRALKRLAA